MIRIKNLKKSYDNHEVLKGISLDIQENEFVSLLGPSGCGKTTLLRILGGFVDADSGEVEFLNKDLLSLPPYKRDLNTVFQSYALFPHLNVYENIAFALRLRKFEKARVAEKVSSMLSLLNLEGFESRSVQSLSGGQRQRVAIARALVNEPKLLLLDEPLGALDLKMRQKMQVELKEIQRNVGITFIYVTHDQEEALSMSDKVVVMQDGIIQQIGSPVDIYNEPKNRFVAEFVGESNIVPGIMLEDFKLQFDNQEFECVDYGFAKGENVEIVIRPEDIDLYPVNKGHLEAELISHTFKGVHNEFLLKTRDRVFKVHTVQEAKVGQLFSLYFDPEDLHVMAVKE